MPGEGLACQQSGSKIVRAKKDSPRLRNVDRQAGNLRLPKFVSDDRGDGFIDLKLDHEIDTLPDEEVGISEGRLVVVLIVDDD